MAEKMNISFHSLHAVVHALGKRKGKEKKVAYEKSVLTRILKNALGGNSLTTVILNCSPASLFAKETISTLKMGELFGRIENNICLNEFVKC